VRGGKPPLKDLFPLSFSRRGDKEGEVDKESQGGSDYPWRFGSMKTEPWEM